MIDLTIAYCFFPNSNTSELRPCSRKLVRLRGHYRVKYVLQASLEVVIFTLHDHSLVLEKLNIETSIQSIGVNRSTCFTLHEYVRRVEVT